MQTQQFIVTVVTEKPVAHLAELIGSRAWTISNVKDVSVQPVAMHQYELPAFLQNVVPTGPAV